jgi:chemotaxis protein MotA
MNKKNGLDLGTVVGIMVGFGSLLTAIILEFNELNPDLGSQFLQVSAILMIIGGSMGATMISFPLEEVTKIPALLSKAFFQSGYDAAEFVDKIVKLTDRARREGILALESEVATFAEKDQFLALGLRLVVDGTEPEIVEEMLENQMESISQRHRGGQDVFNSLGGYSPTMGIIGTVVGLISALAKAGEGGGDPNAVVSAIATAFIATFYGIGLANLLFLPIASKLKCSSQNELFYKRVQVIAILAIQSGENPRLVQDKLSIMFKKGTVPVREK